MVLFYPSHNITQSHETVLLFLLCTASGLCTIRTQTQTAVRNGRIHRKSLQENQILWHICLRIPIMTETIEVIHSRLRELFYKISGPRNKTYPGLISMLQGFQNALHEILANRASKVRARQHGQFWPICQHWAELAVVARPICQDFMQYIFGIFEAH